MTLTGKNTVVLTTEDLPQALKLELKIGEITDQPDGSALMGVDINWLNLREVLEDFVLTALKAGIEKAKKQD